MNHKMIEKDPFQVVGVKRTFSSSNGEHVTGIPKLWEEVHQDGTIDLLLTLNNGSLKGVLGVCASSGDAEQTIDYWIAVEHNGDALPDGLAKFEIPSSKWVVFEVRGPMPEAMQKA
ncbi:GyrI-like domain-containing protein [Anoxybacteroides tepidamans]|uniref:GyrI-like domain-containing protein n=1 Tax=Anoxybacteroides tepidamans TaxID=265948 RepID=UPI000AF67411|nr:GyrI-like domain-containing protein [Anoxybacillus tepidamans]